MPLTINNALPDARLVGEGKMTYFFWDIYNAQLFAPNGQWQGEPPYALTLTYLRDFKGEDIAERSVSEIRKLGFNDNTKLLAWKAQMKALFPDVKDGTKLTGLLTPEGKTRFYLNEELIGSLDDPGFGQHFFAIWLSEKTSEPTLRKKLMGVTE